MTFLQFAFYAFSVALVFAATMVVTIRNPVKSALFLVLAFFSAACIWITLQAEFLAIVLVLVYVGAVMVLFLFVVMMLDIDLAKLRAGFTRYLPIGGLIAVLLVLEIALVMYGSFDVGDSGNYGNPAAYGVEYSNTKALGAQIYTHYVYAFEIAALILLVAIIAAIALTMRRRPNSKYNNPASQVQVNREDRLRIVNMDSADPSATGFLTEAAPTETASKSTPEGIES
ncbi:NADH-quinone oxidoreductase subunit J [Candidatus Spongiihabitans sp.]|uniref:NADH-quinone oxidoreductase subunit J n=1 Tax=Candidatus Spongiihabitans sp. TaxID=3101308 RepID=UPI003C6EC8B4